MIPLVAHRRIWTWLGLCSFEENTSKLAKMIYISFNLSLFTTFVGAVLASAEFVRQSLSTDLEGSLHALFQLTAYTGVVYVTIITFVFRHKITEIFDQLTEIYRKCKIQFEILFR